MTKTRRRICDIIEAHWARDGFGPSVRELADETGTTTTNVYEHLLALERAGDVARTPGVGRTWRVVSPAILPTRDEVVRVLSELVRGSMLIGHDRLDGYVVTPPSGYLFDAVELLVKMGVMTWAPGIGAWKRSRFVA